MLCFCNVELLLFECGMFLIARFKVGNLVFEWARLFVGGRRERVCAEVLGENNSVWDLRRVFSDI